MSEPADRAYHSQPFQHAKLELIIMLVKVFLLFSERGLSKEGRVYKCSQNLGSFPPLCPAMGSLFDTQHRTLIYKTDYIFFLSSYN